MTSTERLQREMHDSIRRNYKRKYGFDITPFPEPWWRPLRKLRRLRKAWLRFQQWRAALKLAGADAKLLPMIRAIRSGGVDLAQYKARLRACRCCPIYDIHRKLCRRVMPATREPHHIPGHWRVTKETILGCQCYVPYLAKTRAPYSNSGPSGRRAIFYPYHLQGCWGRVHIGGTFGWGAEP